MAQRVVNRFSELLAIKERRENRKISRRQVAKDTGLSKYTVDSYYNNDVGRFDSDTLKTLCGYLGCSIGELVVLEDVPEETKTLAPAV